MRKLLPATPDMETQLNLSAKMIDKKTSTPKGNHSYGPFFLEYSLLAEYNLLRKQKVPGVYVIPSAKSPLCWFGVIFVRQGIYQEAVFRFKLLIPDNYPDGDCPQFVFDSFVYHPAIDPVTFELDLKRGFPKWKRNVNHLWQILFYARRIFYKIDTKNPLNKNAAEAYDQNLDSFKSQVHQNVNEWKSRIFNSEKESEIIDRSKQQQQVETGSILDIPDHTDPHYIRFSAFQPEIHPNIVKTMQESAIATKEIMPNNHSLNDQGLFSMSSLNSSLLSNNSSSESGSSSSSKSSMGLSFLEPGSLQIFSKDPSS